MTMQPDGTKPYICQRCGYPFFNQKFLIRQKSAILSPTGKEEIAVSPVLVCDMCNWVLGSEIGDVSKLPPELQESRKKAFNHIQNESKKENDNSVIISTPEPINQDNITRFPK